MDAIAPTLLWAALSGILAPEAVLAQQEIMLDFIEAHRPTGFGPGFAVLQETGVLHGEASSTVVIYGYRIGDAQDRSDPQHMAVFDSSSPGYEVIAGPVLVGGGGVQRFDQLTIKNKVITLMGARWISGDAACCPSGTARIEYSCSHGGCMALGK